LNLENDVLVSLTSTIKESVEHILAEHYGVNHITIQFEYKCCNDIGIIKNR